jgi:hypothetical protein
MKLYSPQAERYRLEARRISEELVSHACLSLSEPSNPMVDQELECRIEAALVDAYEAGRERGEP